MQFNVSRIEITTCKKINNKNRPCFAVMFLMYRVDSGKITPMTPQNAPTHLEMSPLSEHKAKTIQLR